MPTKIEWAKEVWNPITGCTPISEGCKNCYAKILANGRLKGRYGYPKDRPFGGKEPNGEAMEIYLETTNPSLASEWSHRDIHQDD